MPAVALRFWTECCCGCCLDRLAVGDDETPATAGDIDVGGTVTRIAVGFMHVCATLENGGVRCWGRAATGALGYGNIHDVGDNEAPAAAGDVKLR